MKYISLQPNKKEFLGLILNQYISSGWGSPGAKSALRKIQASKGGTVGLTEEELGEIVEALSDYAGYEFGEYSWAPTEVPTINRGRIFPYSAPGENWNLYAR